MNTTKRAFPRKWCGDKTLRSGALAAALALLFVGTQRSIAQGAHAPQPAKAPVGDVERGRKMFVKDGCYECHGTEAQGGGYTGPRLAPPPSPLALLIAQVRRPANEMPPFTKEVLSDQEIVDIYAFLLSIPDPPAVDTIPILRSSK